MPEVGRRLGSLPIGLGALVLWVVAAALATIWYYTLGVIFRKLAAVSIPTGIFGRIHPLAFLKTADHDVRVWLNDAQKYGERGMIWGFTNFAMFWLLIGAAAFVLGQAVFQLGEWTAAYVAKALHSHTATRVFPTIKTTVYKTVRVTSQAIPKLTARVHALEQRTAALVHAAAGTIAQPFPRIGQLERDVKAQGRRLRKAEKALVGAGAAALVWVALKRLGLKWTRCAKVSRVGRFLCSDMPTSLLDSLLAEAALVGGIVGLVEFAEEMGGIVEPMAEGVSFLVGVAEHAPPLPDLIP